MAYETSTEDMMVAIREKIQTLIEENTGLSDIVKVYAGTPHSIPNYPAVTLNWTEDEIEQVHKGQFKVRQKSAMSIIVFNKYLDYKKRQNQLLVLTGKIKKLMVTNRYLDGLRAADDSWRHIDIVLTGAKYEPWIKPNTFVLDSSEIKIEIVTEGI